MLRKFLVLLCCAPFLFSDATAQKPPETEREYEKAYQNRIQQEYLLDVYIPKDLTDAFIQLNRLIDEGSKKKFKQMPEADATRKLYFSFGRWITYNWGFYEGSRLSHHLRDLGVFHPEDMAEFIIITYHRNLNRKKLEVPELIATIQARREKEEKERLDQGTILFQQTRKRLPPPDSTLNNF